jgi:hypothetical protein
MTGQVLWFVRKSNNSLEFQIDLTFLLFKKNQ